MHICVISYDYPDSKRSVFPFVKQLVDAFTRYPDVNCSVISPFSIIKNKSVRTFEELPHNCTVNIIRPKILSFSNITIGKRYISFEFHKRAVNKALCQFKETPDVIYCHFWQAAIEALPYAQKNKVPIIVASGESDILTVAPMVQSYLADLKQCVNGVVCVSTKNKKESIALGLTTEDRCIVIPNAIDPAKFYIADKTEIREQLNLPKDAFIIVYVGWFNERKGAKRVAEALKSTQGVNSIFIGSGIEEPNCEGILFMGRLAHDQIVKYLNAADCFVLPTRAEGCCNAVIEAMACGLPVISSNLPFNWDVLDESNSILINPNDIDEISNAITKIKDDEALRKKLQEGCIKMAKSLQIETRAKKIIEFIKSSI